MLINRQRVQEAAEKEGRAMVALLDITREAGVVKPTVSRVPHKDPSLSTSDETRGKMFMAARVLGYEAKQEKMLSRTTANIMAVHKDTHFMNQADNAYYSSVRTGVEEVCYKGKYKFTSTPFQFIDSAGKKPDGVLVVGNFEKAQVDPVLKKIRTSNIAFTSKVDYYPDKMGRIIYDIKDCVYRNMDYLRKCGHRRVAYIRGCDNEDTPPDFNKSAYFEQYTKSHPGLEFVGSMVGEHSVENDCQMMNRWLAEDRKLSDTFFIFNDPATIGAIKTLNEHSIGAPGVAAVTAINGDSSGTFSFPILTTVDVHTYEMRKEVVAMSEERIHHKQTLTKKMEFQAELVKRGNAKKTN